MTRKAMAVAATAIVAFIVSAAIPMTGGPVAAPPSVTRQAVVSAGPPWG